MNGKWATLILGTVVVVLTIIVWTSLAADAARDQRCSAAGGVIIKGGYCVSRSAVIDL